MTNTQQTTTEDSPPQTGQGYFNPNVGWLILIPLLPVIIYFMTVSRKKHAAKIAAQKERMREASDFHVITSRWIDAIVDNKQVRPRGFGVTLGGTIDRYVAALERLRASSLAEIETSMRRVRVHLTDSAKDRLDAAWKNYQGYEIQQDPGPDDEVPTYTGCKKALVDYLEQMRKIAHE